MVVEMERSSRKVGWEGAYSFNLAGVRDHWRAVLDTIFTLSLDKGGVYLPTKENPQVSNKALFH
jgi:hypothetical protein